MRLCINFINIHIWVKEGEIKLRLYGNLLLKLLFKHYGLLKMFLNKTIHLNCLKRIYDFKIAMLVASLVLQVRNNSKFFTLIYA